MISYLHDFRLLVSSKELRYLARVKQTVDVFKERFLLDLCVREQEHRPFTNRARLFQQSLLKYRKCILSILELIQVHAFQRLDTGLDRRKTSMECSF